MPPRDFEALAKNAFDKIKCTLGLEVTYNPKLGGTHKIRGVFDDRMQEVDADAEVIISSNRFTLGIKLDDLPVEPDKGDIVIIKKIKYQVIDTLEDGVVGASTVLVLHKVC